MAFRYRVPPRTVGRTGTPSASAVEADRRHAADLTRGLLALLFLLLGLLALALYLPAGGFSRWLLFVLVAIGMAYLVLGRLARVMAEPVPLADREPLRRAGTGELGAWIATLERAERGLPYSQRLARRRLARVLRRRLQVLRGLDEGEVDALLADEGRLAAVLGDAALVDLLRWEARDPAADLPAEGEADFLAALDRLTRKVEAWR